MHLKNNTKICKQSKTLCFSLSDSLFLSLTLSFSLSPPPISFHLSLPPPLSLSPPLSHSINETPYSTLNTRMVPMYRSNKAYITVHVEHDECLDGDPVPGLEVPLHEVHEAVDLVRAALDLLRQRVRLDCFYSLWGEVRHQVLIEL